MIPADDRRAPRIAVELPIWIEVLGDPRPHHDAPFVAAGTNPTESVKYPAEMVGTTFASIVCDIAENGCRIRGRTVPPLLSRLAMWFTLPDVGDVMALGLVMWRRRSTAGADDSSTHVGEFGVLFEAVPLEARTAIYARSSCRSRALLGTGASLVAAGGEEEGEDENGPVPGPVQ
jgi:hypothetical protein